jgi:hypothetical protein
MLRRVAFSAVLLTVTACGESGTPARPVGESGRPLSAPASRYIGVAGAAQANALAARGVIAAHLGDTLRALLEADPDAFLVVDVRAGRLVHAVGRLSPPMAAPDRVILEAFTGHHAALLGLREPQASLAVEWGPVAVWGQRAYRLRQVVDGVPVVRRSVKLTLDGEGRVVAFSGATGDGRSAATGRRPAWPRGWRPAAPTWSRRTSPRPR